MNRSYAKKRHISEANMLAEKRFLTKMVTENLNISEKPKINEQRLESAWQTGKFNCVVLNTYKTITNLGDNTTSIKIGNVEYYNNGRARWGGNMYNFWCKGMNIYISSSTKNTYRSGGGASVFDYQLGTWIIDEPNDNTQPDSAESSTPPSGAAGSQSGGGSTSTPRDNSSNARRYKDCSKQGFFSLGCLDRRPATENSVKKLQTCLGFKGNEIDGLFWTKTLTRLNKQFPEMGGVVRINDLEKICNPYGYDNKTGKGASIGTPSGQPSQTPAQSTPSPAVSDKKVPPVASPLTPSDIASEPLVNTPPDKNDQYYLNDLDKNVKQPPKPGTPEYLKQFYGR